MIPQKARLVTTLTLAMIFFHPALLPAAAKGYLQMANGEAHLKGTVFENKMKILSWEWGDYALAEGKEGRQFRPLVLTREVDEASPGLAAAISKGEKFPEVEVALPVGKDHENRFMRYKLKGVRLLSLAIKGSENPGQIPARETVTLGFEEVEVLDDNGEPLPSEN